MIVETLKEGNELLIEKKQLEDLVVTNEASHNAKTKLLDFIFTMENFCEDHNIPFQHAHVVSDEYFPEFIRTKWEELFLKDELGFENTAFGHLINWHSGIEESKEDYFMFDYKGEHYWIGV